MAGRSGGSILGGGGGAADPAGEALARRASACPTLSCSSMSFVEAIPKSACSAWLRKAASGSPAVIWPSDTTAASRTFSFLSSRHSAEMRPRLLAPVGGGAAGMPLAAAPPSARSSPALAVAAAPPA
eukprot:scaffold24481_cov125-Isochrysis_galbana.AAC.5